MVALEGSETVVVLMALTDVSISACHENMHVR